MTIPARREAARLLLSLDPPAWALRHACAVADVASWLARAIDRNGTRVDVAAIEAAALLHDVDKLRASAVVGRRHGDGSAAWLEANGMRELAALVRDHPVTRLADDVDHARLEAAPLESRVVAYADKRAGRRLEPMAERFASWQRRYPAGPADPRSGTDEEPPTGHGWDDEVARRVLARADALEREICRLAGARPAEVRRNRWSRRALREAAR